MEIFWEMPREYWRPVLALQRWQWRHSENVRVKWRSTGLVAFHVSIDFANKKKTHEEKLTAKT